MEIEVGRFIIGQVVHGNIFQEKQGQEKNALSAFPRRHLVKHVLLCYYNIKLEKAMSFTQSQLNI